MSKVFTVAAYIVFAFSMWALGYLVWHRDTAGGPGIAIIVIGATVSIFGMAILLAVKSQARTE